MWSFSFAGSMRSSTALIGRAVGDGDGVGARVGVAPPATADGEGLGSDAEPPQDAARIASTRVRRPTTSVYRGKPLTSAPAGSRSSSLFGRVPPRPPARVRRFLAPSPGRKIGRA